MPYIIVRNDITNMRVDAIVNAASRLPRVNPGVDLAIHKKAGPKLLEARKAIGNIVPGSAVITPAFDLDAKYVIHAATPIWGNGTERAERLLRSAYEKCLQLALQAGCRSVAFPLLATGNHGFPKERSLQIAISVFTEFLLEQDIQIYLVVFGQDSVILSEKLVQSVRSYIDEHYVVAYESAMFGGVSEASHRETYQIRCRREMRERHPIMPCASVPMAQLRSLEDMMQQEDAGFSETLLKLIDKSGMKDSEIYKRANVSKQHFSKIRNNPNHQPTKSTAVAFALALELDLEATRDLLGRAGYALTNSSKFDLIIRYFIEQKIYDVMQINMALYEFDQPLLGVQS